MKNRLYVTWANMKKRCLNKNDNFYKYYGGKGVIICTDWMKFKNFEKWARANGYADNLTIDRLDSDGNYEPSNCQWITKAENTRKAHIGTKHSKKTKQLISKKAKIRFADKTNHPQWNIPLSEERKNKIGRANSKTIAMFSVKQNHLAIFSSGMDAAKFIKNVFFRDRKLKNIYGTIMNCVGGKSKTACGFVWREWM